MKQLRLLLILLIIMLTFFFNIERLDLSQENALNLDTFVYLLGFGAVIAVAGLRVWQKFSPAVTIAIWAVMYILVKLILFFFFAGRPLVGGVYTYLFITELTLLLGLTWLAHKVAAGLYEFEEAVEAVTFANTDKRVHSVEEADEPIQTEMFRSRHNHHPLSVIVLEPQIDSNPDMMPQLVKDVQQTLISRYLINTLAGTLNGALRRTDMVLEKKEQNQIVLVCPDTSKPDTDILLDYIRDVAAEQFNMAIHCGAASFPRDAFTFEELVHQAEKQLKPLISVEPRVQTPLKLKTQLTPSTLKTE